MNSLQYLNSIYLSWPKALRVGINAVIHSAIWLVMFTKIALPESDWAAWHWLQRLQFGIGFALLVAVFYYHNYELLPRQVGAGKLINYALLTGLLILFFEAIHWRIVHDVSRRIYWSDTADSFLIEPQYYSYWLSNTIPFWVITLAWGWLRYYFRHRIGLPVAGDEFAKGSLLWPLHLLFWLFFFSANWHQHGLLDYNMIESASVLLAATVFYVNLLFLIDWGLKRGLSFYLLSVSLLIILCWPLDAWLGFLNANRTWYGTSLTGFTTYTEVLFSFTDNLFWPALLLSCLYAFFSREVAEKTIALQTESENRKAELQALKTQLQPHFMLNVLNGLYADALEENSPKTAAGIISLSRLMQYIIYETDRSKVPLVRELQFLEQYISLQKERVPQQVRLEVVLPDAGTAGLQIAPLLLLPPIENAFKHGISLQNPAHINIRLSLDDKWLSLYVENLLFTKDIDRKEAGGIGLVNMQKRLQLLYPGQHTIRIRQEESKFVVTLRVLLDDTK